MTALPEYRPAPVPAHASSVARRIITAANLVPAGRWVSYGDLAEAIGSAPRGVASALSSVTPLRLATDAVDDTRHWVVPWHRIRTSDGKVRSRAAGAHINERTQIDNAMFVAEGGRLHANESASDGQRFNLAAEIRRLTARGECSLPLR